MNNKEISNDNLIEDSREIKTFMSAIKRFPQSVDCNTGRALFVRSLEQKMRREGTFEKIEEIKSNLIIQQAMKEDYTKFVKRINGMQ